MEPLLIALNIGDGTEKSDGIRMGGVIEDILHSPKLYNLPCIDDGHLIAVLGHNPQVVGDQEHSGVLHMLQFLNHLQYLGLNGHVQGGGWLVGQQQIGIAGQGHSNDYSLFHAAGELVGKLLHAILRNTHHSQHLFGS